MRMKVTDKRQEGGRGWERFSQSLYQTTARRNQIIATSTLKGKGQGEEKTNDKRGSNGRTQENRSKLGG